MSIFSKDGLVFLVQIDHLSGEMIGLAIDQLYEAGAYNVQCIPSLTKKNRPAYLFFIDTAEKHAEAVEEVIVSSLASTGWHRLKTDHRHIAHQEANRQISVQAAGVRFDFNLRVKTSQQAYQLDRPEVDSVLELQDLLEEKAQIKRPFPYLYKHCQDVWINKEDSLWID